MSPALIIVGEVVKLAEKLAWFRPLNDHEPDTIKAADSASRLGRL
jgi:hypothetical protein